MTRINVRSKGASGEREFCAWLEKNFALPEKAKRNLEQVRSGGADIIMPPFSFEIKRVESLDVRSAWIQCKVAAAELELEPVLAHRRNRQPWNFAISASHIGCGLGFISLDERTFKLWAAGIWNADIA
jgi:hypothetical protein